MNKDIKQIIKSLAVIIGSLGISYLIPVAVFAVIKTILGMFGIGFPSPWISGFVAWMIVSIISVVKSAKNK
jgi:hypothetical protein